MKKYIIKSVITVLTVALMTSCTSRKAVESESLAVSEQTTEAAVTDVVSDTTEVSVTTDDFDINDYTFETVYGSQVINYLNHQYYFNGEPIPIVESNYYFVNAFLELSQYANLYGYYPVTSEGFMDLCAEVPADSNGNAPKYKTYGDFFRDYAETMLHSSYIVLKYANDENIVLDDTTVQEIQALLQGIETNNASKEGMTLDEYLALYYGPECNSESFTKVLYNYYLNDVYTQSYTENFDMGDEELPMSTTVRYVLYWAPAAESDEAALEAAKSKADALFEACNGSLDTLDELGTEAQANGECKEYGANFSVAEGQTVPAFDAWCFDPNREVGDIEVIYSEEYGYFVVGYLGLVVDKTAVQDAAARQLSSEISAVIDENKYDFHTDDEFIAPPAVEGNQMITSSGDLIPNNSGAQLVPAETLIQENTEPESNNNVLIIVLIITAVLLIVAIVILIVMSTKNSKNNSVKESYSSSDDETDDKTADTDSDDIEAE